MSLCDNTVYTQIYSMKFLNKETFKGYAPSGGSGVAVITYG